MIVLDKMIHLIPDLISFVSLYTTSLINWHSIYQQWHVSLNFLIIYFNLVRYDVKLFAGYPPENVNVFGNGARVKLSILILGTC